MSRKLTSLWFRDVVEAVMALAVMGGIFVALLVFWVALWAGPIVVVLWAVRWLWP